MPKPGPKPGQHLAGGTGFADPEQIRDDIAALLAGLDAEDGRHSLADRTRVLERAHDLLVEALATVDKI
ncbi:hypothetical protein [Skermania piniformis]|uniref:Uncharacterized protein n=1 Tax=Skermania pinensis TaxID=39122 RepID=A0ABX8SD48_9ACTN|nr:hypothetical protein [Skermania piniformis]QXQ15850.1 hypothetical protein KV203_11080 [Skermania piniformis]